MRRVKEDKNTSERNEKEGKNPLNPRSFRFKINHLNIILQLIQKWLAT